MPPVAVDDDGYPCADEAHVDNSRQFKVLLYAGQVLMDELAGRAAVGSDMAIHYQKGDRGAFIVPDLFVARGVEDRDRLSYKLWEEPTPNFVMEVLSRKTWRKDVGEKKDTYEFLGVDEYWLFDPMEKYLDMPLAGYRLCDGVYERLAPNARGRLPSEALGLELWGGEGELRFHDAHTGDYLMPRRGEQAARLAAETRAAQAEARIAALEAQLRARRG